MKDRRTMVVYENKVIMVFLYGIDFELRKGGVLIIMEVDKSS